MMRAADSALATVSITIHPRNDVPIADDSNVSTDEDTPVNFNLTGSDIDGDLLTYTLLSAPLHGEVGGIAPNLLYTPALDFNGSDQLTFSVSDGLSTSTTAIVTLTVNPVAELPTAQPQTITITEDVADHYHPDRGTGDDLALLTYAVRSQPSHGSLSGIAPNLRYTPDADFHGSDSFSFWVSDALNTSIPATVTITVEPINDAPIADGQTVQTSEEQAIHFTLTGSDIEHDVITYQPTHTASYTVW